MISFASYYQTSFRIEVPLWHKVEDGITLLGKGYQGMAQPMLAQPGLPDNVQSPIASSEAVVGPQQDADQDAE